MSVAYKYIFVRVINGSVETKYIYDTNRDDAKKQYTELTGVKDFGKVSISRESA